MQKLSREENVAEVRNELSDFYWKKSRALNVIQGSMKLELRSFNVTQKTFHRNFKFYFVKLV